MNVSGKSVAQAKREWKNSRFVVLNDVLDIKHKSMVWWEDVQEELEFLLSNGHKKILCDTYPKDMYKYRVFFKNKFSPDKRSAFLIWANNYGNKLLISETSRRWLMSQRYYAQDPFMYVIDDKMMSMVGLYLSGYVKKTEEFILRENVLVA